jgi:hypothetical protein
VKQEAGHRGRPAGVDEEQYGVGAIFFSSEEETPSLGGGTPMPPRNLYLRRNRRWDLQWPGMIPLICFVED